MQVLDKLKYTKEHEWIDAKDDKIGVVGITDFAQNELGDIVFLELPLFNTRLYIKLINANIKLIILCNQISKRRFSNLYSYIREINGNNFISIKEKVFDSYE